MSGPTLSLDEIKNNAGKSLAMLRDSWVDLLKFSLLPLVLCAFFVSWIQVGLQSSITADQEPDLPLIMQQLSWVYVACLPLVYMHYGILRYVRDRLCNTLNPNVFSYWIPQKTLLGCIGLGFISIPYVLIAMIPVIIGLLFLILPGIALYMLVSASILFFYIIYLLHPDRGIFNAIQRAMAFTLRHWLPLLAYTTLVAVGWLIVYFVLMIPMMIVSFVITIISAIVSFQPGLMLSMFMQTLASTLLTVLFSALWAHIFGQLYLDYSGDTPAQGVLPQTGAAPSVFGTQSAPLTSPLPPSDPPSAPPREPGSNPWGS